MLVSWLAVYSKFPGVFKPCCVLGPENIAGAIWRGYAATLPMAVLISEEA